MLVHSTRSIIHNHDHKGHTQPMRQAVVNNSQRTGSVVAACAAPTFQFLAPNLLNPCPRFFSIAFIGNSNLLMLAHSWAPSARHCTKLYSSKRSSSSLSLCDKASNCAARAKT
jgi:hypothetical protein